MAWTPAQMAVVEGHASHVNAVTADEGLFKAALDPENPVRATRSVAGDRATRYDAQTNPAGVRCSVLDIMSNLLGPRPQAEWTRRSRLPGHGFAGVPFAHGGVQYGLAELSRGLITPAQFVDLNAKIGGLNVDSQPKDARTAGDRPRSAGPTAPA